MSTTYPQFPVVTRPAFVTDDALETLFMDSAGVDLIDADDLVWFCTAEATAILRDDRAAFRERGILWKSADAFTLVNVQPRKGDRRFDITGVRVSDDTWAIQSGGFLHD